jgi:hypothetical protein
MDGPQQRLTQMYRQIANILKAAAYSEATIPNLNPTDIFAECEIKGWVIDGQAHIFSPMTSHESRSKSGSHHLPLFADITRSTDPP